MTLSIYLIIGAFAASGVLHVCMLLRIDRIEMRIEHLEADSHPPIDLTPAMIDTMKALNVICPIPPAGYYCTRDVGHTGPCAAHKITAAE